MAGKFLLDNPEAMGPGNIINRPTLATLPLTVLIQINSEGEHPKVPSWFLCLSLLAGGEVKDSI